MPGSGTSCTQKRKRNWAREYPSFPGGSPLKFRRAGLRTVGTTASLSEAWTQLLRAEKKTVTEKHLELSLRPKEATTVSKSTCGLTDITRSSSGSDVSDEDKTFFKSQRDNERGFLNFFFLLLCYWCVEIQQIYVY
uniref:DUF4502 domain-containing protein n=1 Tax=Suricata suricatta TaxID=37032 RepID=A0A673U7C7_SURSU